MHPFQTGVILVSFSAGLLLGGYFFIAVDRSGGGAAARAMVAVGDPGEASLALVLQPHDGADELDQAIAHSQTEVVSSENPAGALARLAWLYISKARASGEHVFFRLAEHCAYSLESRDPGSSDALLIRAFIRYHFKRLEQAELLAEKLIYLESHAKDGSDEEDVPVLLRAFQQW